MNTVDSPIWLAPPPAEPARRSHRGALVAVLGACAAAGIAAAIALTAGAGNSAHGAGSSNAGFAASQSGPGGSGGSGVAEHGARMPRLAGTVTAVDTGRSTVTVKTASGTATYAVDSHSDIDKNGEANLAALKAGDAVTFSTVTTNGKATIAILHSGDETKNRPSGGFGAYGGAWGAPGAADSEQGPAHGG